MNTTAFRNVTQLDPSDTAQVKAASELHLKLLPTSVLSQLGYTFLFRFYYRLLPKAKLIDVFLYKRGNDYVGFIACTPSPFTLMRCGMTRYPFHLFLVLCASILARPKRIAVPFGLDDGIDLKGLEARYNDTIGQFMSFGVLPEHRKIVDPEANLSIPNVLMREVFHYFSSTHKDRFFLLVLKSNEPAIKLYERYNGYVVEGGSQTSDIYLFDVPE